MEVIAYFFIQFPMDMTYVDYLERLIRHPPLPILVDTQVKQTGKGEVIGDSVELWELNNNNKLSVDASWKRNSQHSNLNNYLIMNGFL